FWLAVIVGAIVMFLLSFLPLVGPLIGGLVAGLIAKGDVWNGAKAGFGAGLIGAILAAVILLSLFDIFTIYTFFHRALAGILIRAGLGIFLIAVIGLYHALLGLVGGAVGAAIVKG
ncbi:MAG: DUF5518 domain-containing protein, partial [Methanomicrobiales archaeon]|nr:DUF5518 domain-containing protein [Methanomicrobiales archaeon]